MGHSSAKKTKALQKSLWDKQWHKQRTAALLSAVVSGAVVMQYMALHLVKTAMYNSKLSSKDWVQELLHGHPGWFYDSFGMSKHVFRKLVQELQMYVCLHHSKYSKKEKQIAIFLHLC